METERQLQERVKHWLIDDLHYKFLGSRENINNSCVIDDLLSKNLRSRNYSLDVIETAIADLNNTAKNQTLSLYQANEKVYNLLRYGDIGVRDRNEKFR